jgi:peroxiredoxin
MKIIAPLILLACATLAGAAEPLAAGARLPDVTVRTEKDVPIKLAAALKSEPAVILFYRGGWCPYCTKHLTAMMDIEEKLRGEGYSIFAISTDRPSKLAATPDREKLNYTLLSDSKMDAADAFGITFTVSNETLEKYKGYNIDLEAASGEKHHKLPHPAVYIVDKEGVIRFAHVNEDYKVRLKPEDVLAAAMEAKNPAPKPTP